MSFPLFLFYAYNFKTYSDILCVKKYAGCRMYQEAGDTFDSKMKYSLSTQLKLYHFYLLLHVSALEKYITRQLKCTKKDN
jgi:hypothetical protein